jgi:hypothetical protein
MGISLSHPPTPDDIEIYLVGLILPGLPLTIFKIYLWLSSWRDTVETTRRLSRKVPRPSKRLMRLTVPQISPRDLAARPALAVIALIWLPATYCEASFIATFLAARDCDYEPGNADGILLFQGSHLWTGWNTFSVLMVAGAILTLIISFASSYSGWAFLIGGLVCAFPSVMGIMFGFFIVVSIVFAIQHQDTWGDVLLTVAAFAGTVLYLGSTVAAVSASDRLGQLTRSE